MIRLPKASKSAMKNRIIPRPSLANIVKELGKNFYFVLDKINRPISEDILMVYNAWSVLSNISVLQLPRLL